MKFKNNYLFCLFCIILIVPMIAAGNVNNPPTKAATEEIPKLQNPMSVQYLKKKLHKSQPRLVLNSKIEKELKKKLETDPVVQNMYKAIQLNAAEIQKQALLERIMIGRRLLSVSREMQYRMNMLGMVYRIEKDPEILQRINDEVVVVCNFSDWNPSHYLDVAEMSMAVAFALDWTAGALPKSTVELAKTSLIEKGIKPSYKEGNNWWITQETNWNQVCHGGMIAASIAVAEKDPELAAKTISRALDNMSLALEEYSPDGVYPEGSSYWNYGTTFSVVTAAMFESAFGNDFGLSEFHDFLESANFRVLCNAPSGWYYNFSDCKDKRSENGDITLAWFAAKTGNKLFFEKERFLRSPGKIGKLSWNTGIGLVWLSQFEAKNETVLPSAWKGDGANPLVFFTGGDDDLHQYYFAGKGGRASVNHGNMDAGSFVFELNGVRWVIDPGNQDYYELEKTGFVLFGRLQTSERWTLLTKNNFGHSTISVNSQFYLVDGKAIITDFKDGEFPEATIDMSPVFGEQLKSAERTFLKDSPASLLIKDRLELSDETELVTWQLMTTADVEIVKGGVILKQDGKKLKLENLSHPDFTVSIISLYPAPLKLDRQIEGLKRIELRIPAWTFEGKKGEIRVRLSEY